MAGFNTISLKLKEMYQMITLGGDAELELVDSLDPFSEVGAPSATAFAGAIAVDRITICLAAMLTPLDPSSIDSSGCLALRLHQLGSTSSPIN